MGGILGLVVLRAKANTIRWVSEQEINRRKMWQYLHAVAVVDGDSSVLVVWRDSDFSVIFYAKFRFRRW
jgi:hypothetical protein